RNTRVTAGLKWAPDSGPSTVISTARPAPVANVLPSSARATLPPARRSPMMPEPITTASSSAVPNASAAKRRDTLKACSGGSRLASRAASDTRSRVPHFAYLVEPALQRQPIELLQRQVDEDGDPVAQHAVGIGESEADLGLVAGRGGRIGDAPVRRH